MSDAANRVVAYFEGTRWDYRHLWRSEKTGAMHFGYYDDETRGHVDAVRRMTSRLAELARISSTDRVLDAGCGLGGCAVWLARNRGCRVTGVNITPYQVAAARQSAARAGAGDAVEFVEADVTRTRLPDEAFTVVWALESIVHVHDKSAFLREAHRVLRPGGRLMIAEYLLRDGPALSEAEEADLRTWCDGWAMAGLLSEARYRDLLAENGFKDVQVVDISQHVEPSLRRLGWLVRLLQPTAPIFERLRILRQVPADNLRASAAQIRTFDDGVWRYKVMLAERDRKDPGAGG